MAYRLASALSPRALRFPVLVAAAACVTCNTDQAAELELPAASAAETPPRDSALAPDARDASLDDNLDPTLYVDPFIGTARVGEGWQIGNTFPGAVAPWGMVPVSPHNKLSTKLDYVRGELPAAAGYLTGEQYIYGFGLTHLSGAGCPDLGAPVLTFNSGDLQTSSSGYRRSYRDEEARPGYYAVTLQPGNLRVETTSTQRVGFLRANFGERGASHLLVDVASSLAWGGGGGYAEIVSSREISGWVETGGFCNASNKQRVYFFVRSNVAAHQSGTWRNGLLRERVGGAYLSFDADSAPVVEVAAGISYVSVANARANLDAEVGTRRFSQVAAGTREEWRRQLSHVRVASGSRPALTQFYTALYHSLLHPNVVSDVGGDYLGADHQVHKVVGRAQYSVYSLWDTYRNLHALLTLLYPRVEREMMASLAATALEHRAPLRWELYGHEVNPMVGEPMAAVLAEAVAKGMATFEVAPVYRLLRDAALGNQRPGQSAYRQLGYVAGEEAGTVWGPVSTTLEYAYADHALAQLAAALRLDDDARLFAQRARNWTHLVDREGGFLRMKNRDGSWSAGFSADATSGAETHFGQREGGGPGYVEGTAWHYAFFVPHDPVGLAQAYGGPRVYVDKLWRMFETGRFTMSNQPDIANPYLFTYFEGEAWRTQHAVRTALDMFGSGRAGLPGNDDLGTLSAWYVFSALGFYPDNPVSDRYSIGSPTFARAVLELEGGKRFEIAAAGAARHRPYIAEQSLDGAVRHEPFLRHGDIIRGGKLTLKMSATR